jgi:hypothetical protein
MKMSSENRYAILLTPQYQHHSTNTTVPTPQYQHYSTNTTVPTPQYQHHSTNTTVPTPQYQHHSTNTTVPTWIHIIPNVSVFTDIFNLSLTESVMPTCFKQATTVPVPKEVKVTCLNDYRP